MSQRRYMPSVKTKLLTADDLLHLHSYGVRGELIRGILHTTGLNVPEYDEPRVNLERELRGFVEGWQLGYLLTNAGIWVESDPDTVRKADIAYISIENMRTGALNHGYLEAAPDLLVDVIGPTDILRIVRENAQMWSIHGVRLVWIANLAARSVDVYAADGSVVALTEDDSLDGGNVLPGFVCRVGEIF